jgi:hypothetical protein
VNRRHVIRKLAHAIREQFRMHSERRNRG